MTIFLYILGVFILIFLIGRMLTYLQFNRELNKLFAQSKKVPPKNFSYRQLFNLPEPVQRYFKHVLNEGQAYISYARLKHNGQFKTAQNKDWVNIEGEQYFTVEKPSFIWKGVTTMFTARDMYIADEGKLVVSLLSMLDIVNAKGASYNQGELLRWLAENVWFPTNLLPSENLQWFPIDAHTAKLTFDYKDLSLFYIVVFNSVGEIIKIETKRYIDDKKLETWVGKLSNYQEINGVLIPTDIEAAWELETGDFTYAKFHVKRIEYDKPERF